MFHLSLSVASVRAVVRNNLQSVFSLHNERVFLDPYWPTVNRARKADERANLALTEVAGSSLIAGGWFASSARELTEPDRAVVQSRVVVASYKYRGALKYAEAVDGKLVLGPHFGLASTSAAHGVGSVRWAM